MSTALVRQALEFVDRDENSAKNKKANKKKKPTNLSSSGQAKVKQVKYKKKKGSKSKLDEVAKENIKKLLALSEPVVDKKVAKQIVTRASKGKPLADKIKVKKDTGKSILFPED